MADFEREDHLLTSDELRRYLGIGRTKLYQLYRDPSFPAFRLGEGGAWLVRRSALRLEHSRPRWFYVAEIVLFAAGLLLCVAGMVSSTYSSFLYAQF